MHVLYDCQLSWIEKSDDSRCSTCGESRWKGGNGSEQSALSGKKKRIPARVLCYFPLKSGLKRLFMFPELASSMCWHAQMRTKDGKLRHPADFEAWRTLDSVDTEFAEDPRNVRLGMARDGS